MQNVGGSRRPSTGIPGPLTRVCVDGQRTFRVGSRASPLSVVQTEEVLSLLRPPHPGARFEVVPITTEGDRKKAASISSLGRGAFVREIERALLDGMIDLAVHSAKDLTVRLPDGLTARAAGRRRDPRDVLIDRWGLPLEELPAGARLGTGSPRRTASIKAVRRDLTVVPIRGNVGTRLEKAKGGDYDGVVLAAAGVLRLNREREIDEYLPPELFVPEVGQGTLAVEARRDDETVLDMLEHVMDQSTSAALRAERSFLAEMGGGCTVPVAAYARADDAYVTISSMAALPDGSRFFRALVTAPANDPEDAGRRAARALLDSGAKEIVSR